MDYLMPPSVGLQLMLMVSIFSCVFSPTGDGGHGTITSCSYIFRCPKPSSPPPPEVELILHLIAYIIIIYRRCYVVTTTIPFFFLFFFFQLK